MSADIMDMLSSPQMTTVCAPMVRYSKLAFRTLVRQYNCDICFTPMIIANSFVQSEQARQNEFTTNIKDQPLVVQFAANNPHDFANAAELVSPYCNGVDLNCGCPQRWAIKDGYGVNLLNNPHLIRDMILQVRNRISHPFTISVKIRLLNDIKKTHHLCKILENAGISFLTIHARTQHMRKQPILLDDLKLICDTIQIPIIANGDVKTLHDAQLLLQQSKCQGIMAANGLLCNPALFTGATTTPFSCIQHWLNITDIVSTNYTTLHHHLIFMLEKVLPRKQRLLFNNLNNIHDIRTFIQSHLQSTTTSSSSSSSFSSSMIKPINCEYNNIISQTSYNNDYNLSKNTIIPNKYNHIHHPYHNHNNNENYEYNNYQSSLANLFNTTTT